MPYYSTSGWSKLNDSNWSLEYDYPITGVHGQQIGSSKSAVPVPAAASKRTGSNSSILDLLQVYGSKAVQVIHKKQTVGWVLKRVPYEVYYRDRRGRLRSKTKYRKKRVPVRVDTPRVIAARDFKKEGANPTFFLKPQRLTRSLSYTKMVPETLHVTRRWLIGENELGQSWQNIAMNITGPGRFPLYNTTGWFPVVEISPVLQYKSELEPTQSISDAALNKLYSKVASSLPDYMTAAAETPELVRTLRKILTTGLGLARDIKRLDVQRLKGRLHGTTATDLWSLWLGWVYGVAPVIGDITDTINVLKDRDRVWRTYSASSKNVYEPPPNWGIPLYYHGPFVSKRTHIERWGVIMEGKLSINDVLKQADQLKEYAGTAIELIPFSFMLEWAVPIVDYLKSSSIFEKQLFHAWLTSSEYQSDKFEGHLGEDLARPGEYFFDSPDFTLEAWNFVMERRPQGNYLPDMPDVKVKKPQFDHGALNRIRNSFGILVTMTDGLRNPLKSF